MLSNIELTIHRKGTERFIASDPTEIVLTTTVETWSGGTKTYGDGEARQSQSFKVIWSGSDNGIVVKSEGTTRRFDFVLVGRYDAEVAIGDHWNVDGQHFQVEWVARQRVRGQGWRVQSRQQAGAVMAKVQVNFDSRNLKRNLSGLHSEINRKMAAVTQYDADYATGWLKTNAPWHDNTGAARSGLTSLASSINNQHEILMAYSVYYGIWLEVAHSGKWAVLTPGMRIIGDKVMRDMEMMLRTAFGMR